MNEGAAMSGDAGHVFSRDDQRRSRIFVHGALATCLILQRFGVIVGDSALFLSLPFFAGLLGWALLTGQAQLRGRGTALYMLFAAWTLVVTLVAITAPDARFGVSLPSLAAILVTYAFTTVGPSARFDREMVLPLFLSYVRVLSFAGIVQWVLQFAGLRIFSFMLAVPPLRPVLVETQFNFNPILHYGSTILRSNGFFLLEPSIFSQTLALAVVLDYFVLGRVKWLPLYLLAYLLTFSGTGALSLVLAIPFYACMSARNFGRVAGLVIAGTIALVAAAIAFPAEVGSLLSRADELNYSGSSGYARFIGPFLPLADLGHEARFMIGWGPGATERYIYHEAGTGNSIAKLMMDYGLVGITLFMTMLVGTLWSRDLAILSILAVVTFIVGGGYLLFTPMLVLLFVLCIWSARPTEPASTAA